VFIGFVVQLSATIAVCCVAHCIVRVAGRQAHIICPHYPYFLFGGKKKVTKKKPLLSDRSAGQKIARRCCYLSLHANGRVMNYVHKMR